MHDINQYREEESKPEVNHWIQWIGYGLPERFHILVSFNTITFWIRCNVIVRGSLCINLFTFRL